MEMKSYPKVANQNFSTSDNTANKPLKPSPKKHRAYCYMLRTGINGFTENEILYYCRLSSGRNYPTELERLLDIRLERLNEANPDGIGSHFRYRFTCQADVLKVIQLVNQNAARGNYQPLTQHEINSILELYPDYSNAA